MTFDTHLTHLVRMALQPGFLDHARFRARELEAIYPGITAAVRSALERQKSSGAVPPTGR